MKLTKLLCAALICAALPVCAAAQNQPVPSANQNGRGIDSSASAIIVAPSGGAAGQGKPVAEDHGLPVACLSGCAGVYTFTPLGFQQLTGLSTATGFTPPATSTVCFIQTETTSVRYRTDGVNPTSTVGMTLAVGTTLQLSAGLSAVKFITTTGTTILDIDCYK